MLKQQQKEKVTIIIPVYQAQATLERCIRSALNQTYRNLEILLIDDGSTDGSGEICDRMKEVALERAKAEEKGEKEDSTGISRVLKAGKTDKESDAAWETVLPQFGESVPAMDGSKQAKAEETRLQTPVIEVFHTENQGVSAARNLGIDKATGIWIAFVDADDELRPDFIDHLIESTAKSEFDLCVQEQVRASTLISGYSFIQNHVVGGDTHVWGKLFRRSAVGDLRFANDITIGEDMIFLLHMALQIGSFVRINVIDGNEYAYFENEEGAMLRPYKPSFLDQITCWEQAEEILLAHKEKLAPSVFVQLGSIQIISALLVAGKAAQAADLSGEEKSKVISTCLAAIKHGKNQPGAFSALSKGYKVKCTVFQLSPSLYMNLYRQWKK